MNNFSLDFYNPDIRILFIFIALAIVLFLSFRKTKEKKGAMIILIIRIIVLFLATILLSKPTLNWKKALSQKTIIELWIDNSKSIGRNENITPESYRKSIGEITQFLTSENFDVRRKFFGSDVESGKTKIDLSDNATDLSQLFVPQDISAAILISDGQFNTGINPYSMKFVNNYPVFCLGVGDTTKKLDAKVVSLKVPSKVKLDEKFEINTELSLPASDEKYGVILYNNGDEVEKKEVVSTSTDFLKNLTFQQIAQTVGENEYKIEIRNINDINLANNQKQALQNVLPMSKKVLIVCGAPSFETRALMKILQKDEDFEPTITYLRSGKWIPENVISEEYDFIIYVHYPEKNINEIDDLMEKFANVPALIFLDKYSEINRINNQQTNSIVNRYIYKSQSVEIQQNSQEQGHPILRDIDNKTEWDKLPPITIDFSQLILNRDFQVILETSGKNSIPVFAVRENLGILNGNDFWRWENMTNSQNYSQLITNTIKYLTEKGRQSNVQIATEKKLYLQGETAKISGVVYDLKGNTTATADVQVQIIKDSSLVDDFYISWKENQFSGKYTFSNPGDYQIKVQAFKENAIIGTKILDVKVENRELEYLDIGLNQQVMQFISKENKGDFFQFNEYEKLSGTIHHKDVTKNQNYNIEFHKNIFTFLILIGMLVFEWILRKYFGFL